MGDLTGLRALVCGGTQGIGYASACALAQNGATVTLLARSETALVKKAGELPTPAGQQHQWICADLSNPDPLVDIINSRTTTSGPIHILINNSGGPPGGPIAAAAPGEFSKAFSQHLLSSHIIAQALIPGMKQAQWGRIINIISTSVKQPLAGLGVSNTVRAAVANWSKTLATEVAPFGITVNNVLPGATGTTRLSNIIATKAERSGKPIREIEEEMRKEIPMQRFATPDEIAAAVAFLASRDASYITGINIPVDGGRTGSL